MSNSLYDIDPQEPSCGNCVSGEYDSSDDCYNQETWYRCGNDATASMKLTGDETEDAKNCGFYKPVIIERCSFCHKKMNIPVYKVEYWSYDFFPAACCSQKCEDKHGYQFYWWAMGDCEQRWWMKLIYRFNRWIVKPEPKYDY